MKPEWETKRLRDVLRLEYGKPLPPADRTSNGKFAAFGANGEKTRTNQFYHDQPSIIVGRKGSAGELTLAEEPFWPLDVTYFVTYDRERHDLHFLHYLLQTLDLPKLAKGIKPGLNREEAYREKVLVPPLAEQRRIVEVLDEAFGALATATANTQQALTSARELFESTASQLFAERRASSPTTSLAEVATNLDAKRRPITKRDRQPGNVPYYGASGVVDHVRDHLFDEDLLLVSEDGANLLARTYPIAFSISGKSWVNNHAHVLHFSNETTRL